tara:strand:+ start:15670 stop:16941 length:1272 start_codon:yes stop_codon:yes gene_type:complete
MTEASLFDPIQILYDSHHALIKDAVLIIDNKIKAFGEEARQLAQLSEIHPEEANEKLLAPCLVDPHSILLDPINGKSENLQSLIQKASASGYGQLAVLPNGGVWRDAPNTLTGLNHFKSEVLMHWFGSLSLRGEGKELSPHADLLQYGAIGIAESHNIPPAELLRKTLLLNEIDNKPIFLAPIDKSIQGDGIVREGVEALRSGWVLDPIESETIPLGQLIEYQKQYPNSLIRLMNISTSSAVSMLEKSEHKSLASVCWWNLVSDSSNLVPSDIGWRVVPSLGTPADRARLIKGLKQRVITAVSVNAIALDASEVQQPIDKRLPGLSGHHLVLPLLWNELIVKSGWKVEELWEVLSFGASKMLSSPQESLKIGSNRWLIFDPDEKWVQTIKRQESQVVANQPLEGKEILGKVIKCGISGQAYQS